MLHGGAAAQTTPTTGCPQRPLSNAVVKNPLDLTSTNGALKVDFTLRSLKLPEQFLKECYLYETSSGPVEAPTLRLNPGDQLELTLTNRLTFVPPAPPVGFLAHDMAAMPAPGTPHDPCLGGAMVATSTNIHFHGLGIPPKCHQDDVLITGIENTDPPFSYSFQIPPDHPPGMYWYHPHVHGFTTLQVNGGAAGVLIVGGMETVKPEVAGLPERVLVVRQEFENPDSWLAGPNRLTLNFQPARYRHRLPPILQMKPGVKEFWRVANAASQAFLSLQVLFGTTPQNLTLVALDGVPVRKSVEVQSIELPPAGRAEFIVTGPPSGQAARLQTAGFDTGPIGPPNPTKELAEIVATANAQEPPAFGGGNTIRKPRAPTSADMPLKARVTARRAMYFAEAAAGTNGPTEFFLTLEGQKPKMFTMSSPPAVVTKVGAVEDWTIANHAGEVHTFHIHQIHFLFLEVNGKKLTNPEWRDTVIVPAWDGVGPYPTVKLRMDFRDPRIAGTFVFHCHILDHEDGGMMAKIQVNPK